VAAASIDLLLESDWQTQVSTIENRLNTELTKYRDHELVKDVRVKGAIGVVELNEPLDEAMAWLPGFIINQGIWIRPFRTMIYIMPPYIINESDLYLLCDAIGNILNKLSSN
jgi:adenosylmethionine---8-amino-7-oxononanoate aminotransferase